jgi:hypothetical protein
MTNDKRNSRLSALFGRTKINSSDPPDVRLDAVRDPPLPALFHSRDRLLQTTVS